MLGSISPLGERARGQRWSVTTAAFVVGSAIGGGAVGVLLGAVGAEVVGGVDLPWRLGLLALVTLGGALLDAGGGGLRLPTVRRQVNEAWIGRYRGWVYGTGFGLQLGIGVGTVVTTSTVYAAFAAAFLSGGASRGAVIAGSFGLLRGATLLLGARTTRPNQLGRLDAALRRFDARAKTATLLGQSAVAVAAALGAIR